MHRHLIGAVGAFAVMSLLSTGFLNAQIAAPGAESRYIPAESMIGLIVRPSEIVQSPEIQKLYKLAQSLPGGLPERDLGIQLADIDMAVTGLTMPEAARQVGGDAVPTLMLRTKDAATLKAFTAKVMRQEMIKRTLPGTSIEAFVSTRPRLQPGMGKKIELTNDEVERLQAKAKKAVNDPDVWKISDTLIFPDDRTMVFCQQGADLVSVLEQLKPGAAAPGWQKQYEPASKLPLAAFIDLKQLRGVIKMKTAERPPMGRYAVIIGMLSPLWEKADLAVISLDTAAGLKLSLVAHSSDADSAKALKRSLEELVATGKSFLPVIKHQASHFDLVQPGLGEKLYDDLEKAVNELSVTQTGTTTELKFALPQQTLAMFTSSIFTLLEKSKEEARQNQGMMYLKDIGLAMHRWHEGRKAFPAAARMNKEGQPPHSWRIAILPYLDDETIDRNFYNQYNFDEPWDSEANKKILAKMPAVYRAPDADPNSTNTSYVVPIIDKGIFSAAASTKGPRIRSITDGLSKTIMVIETETSIPWTKPEDLAIDPTKQLPALGFAKSPTLNVLFADGSAHRLIKNPTLELLLPFLTASGGEISDLEKLEAPAPAGMKPPGDR